MVHEKEQATKNIEKPLNANVVVLANNIYERILNY